MRSYGSLLVVCCLIFGVKELKGQSVEGRWYSLDPDDQKETIIELYKKNDKLYGKVIALLQDEDKHKTCRKCPDGYKDKPILGLEILRDFTLEDDLWTNGVILIPKNGKEYQCNISVDDNGRLVIRGYIGFSLLGRSTYWYRVEG